METWIIWAIISVFTGWFFHFLSKVTAERNYDSNRVNYISYIFCTVFMWALLTIQGNFFPWDDFGLILMIAVWNIVFYSSSFMTRVHAMRHIDTVVFYPLYKTFWPIFVTCISILLFKESLSPKEVLGIMVWITVPLLLITKKENQIQNSLYIWVLMVVITSILTSISIIMPKLVQELSLDISVFLFLNFLFWIPFSYLLSKLRKSQKNKSYETKGIYTFSALMWFINIIAFYTFIKAMEWNLAVAFTINSFAILIPIILSIIFYGEHFNLKKWIVIALSIVSILLFI